MSNVLSEQKRQQVIALGRLGWSLRRIEQETGVRRETASAYLKASAIAVRAPGAWGRRGPAKPANETATGSSATESPELNPNPENLPSKRKSNTQDSKPANEVATGSSATESPELNPNPNPENLPSERKSNSQDSKPANEVTTGFGVELRLGSENPARTPSLCEPIREAIELGLSRGRNAMAIWQDLVADHGFTGAYGSVKRFVRKLQGNQPVQARAVILTAPGEEAQVDYGTGPMVRDPKTGKYRRTRLFVMTLGYSRKSVRLLTFRSSARIWAELHEKAFRRLGGCTRVVVLDNLREGVLTPDIYDPILNPLYRDVLAHYGAVALPCRVKDPDRKGKVESAVGHAQRTPLKGMRFESLEEAQAYLDRWEERCADTRIHGTTKRQVAAMFAEEKPALLPLPLEPFRYFQHGKRVVHPDGCIEVEAAYYSLPPGRIGQEVQVQWDETLVRILDPKTGHLLREHLRQIRGRHRFEREDIPARMPLQVAQLLWRCERAGTNIGVLCRRIYDYQGSVGVRRIQGVLSLAKRFGVTATNNASAAALEARVYQYQFVRRYLERTPQLSLRHVDPLIRELVEYRDLINKRTQEPKA